MNSIKHATLLNQIGTGFDQFKFVPMFYLIIHSFNLRRTSFIAAWIAVVR
jgi:hypothetical protein